MMRGFSQESSLPADFTVSIKCSSLELYQFLHSRVVLGGTSKNELDEPNCPAFNL